MQYMIIRHQATSFFWFNSLHDDIPAWGDREAAQIFSSLAEAKALLKQVLPLQPPHAKVQIVKTTNREGSSPVIDISRKFQKRKRQTKE
jgi:hypothetical protein